MANSSADWARALQEAFRDAGSLASHLDWPLPAAVESAYPVLVPRRLADRIKEAGPDSALARQFLPHADELAPEGLADPIGDQKHAKTSQLVHRYGNRALLLPTTACPVNCRYCFRKNELQDGTFGAAREETLAYLRAHPEIEEVIFTGGDPLVLSDEKLDGWLTALAAIPHVRWVRFHTRVPVVLPERLNPELAALLKRHRAHFADLIMVVHTNHVMEWDPATRARVREFLPELTWLSQTVLLRGVNDTAIILEHLFRQLVADGVRPYYLHHPDDVRGGRHFCLSRQEGAELYRELRQRLPGWALPQYVVETPDGGGKEPAFQAP